MEMSDLLWNFSQQNEKCIIGAQEQTGEDGGKNLRIQNLKVDQ